MNKREEFLNRLTSFAIQRMRTDSCAVDEGFFSRFALISPEGTTELPEPIAPVSKEV
jgi:hypothetical protein